MVAASVALRAFFHDNDDSSVSTFLTFRLHGEFSLKGVHGDWVGGTDTRALRLFALIPRRGPELLHKAQEV